MSYKTVKLADLPIEWKRGSGLKKSDITKDGKNPCILYGELFTTHKKVAIDKTQLSYTNKSGQVISKQGDVLVPATSTASRKEMILARQVDSDDIILGGDINIIRAKEGVFAKKYLPYFFESLEAYKQLDRHITGSTGIIHISNSGIKNLELPLPEISEQERIVAKIEELFSELDNASSAINTAIKARKTYLQSVLKKLYTPQADWTEIKSEKLFSYVTSGSRGWAKYYSDDADKPYFLRVTNVNYETIDLDLRAEKLKYVDLPETVEGRRTLVQPGDILISITGYVGMIGVVPVDIPEAYISQHISLARPISEINSKYLAYYLISKTGGLRQLELLQKGATKAGLTLGDIKNVMFPVAPRDEQDRIVDTIDQIMSEVAALHRELTSLRQQSLSLKQSILSKAFKGELV